MGGTRCGSRAVFLELSWLFGLLLINMFYFFHVCFASSRSEHSLPAGAAENGKQENLSAFCNRSKKHLQNRMSSVSITAVLSNLYTKLIVAVCEIYLLYKNSSKFSTSQQHFSQLATKYYLSNCSKLLTLLRKKSSGLPDCKNLSQIEFSRCV